jgi:hypothetical protein
MFSLLSPVQNHSLPALRIADCGFCTEGNEDNEGGGAARKGVHLDWELVIENLSFAVRKGGSENFASFSEPYY